MVSANQRVLTAFRKNNRLSGFHATYKATRSLRARLEFECEPGRILAARHPLMPEIIIARLEGASWQEAGRRVGRSTARAHNLAHLGISLVADYWGVGRDSLLDIVMPRSSGQPEKPETADD